jgi:hypothetical protein
MDPQHERRMPQLDARQQNPIKRNKNRDLHDNGQTSAKRIDFFCLL